MLYCITGILLIGGTTFFAFGGIHKITAVTDKMVPVMAVIYCGTVLLIAFLNIGTIPYFFGAVFGGAFTPEAVFGGFFGTALAQGVKRGLMSNEAGQGTITMSAAASDAEHPCEQGVVQALGVFLDTMVVCTLFRLHRCYGAPVERRPGGLGRSENPAAAFVSGVHYFFDTGQRRR